MKKSLLFTLALTLALPQTTFAGKIENDFIDTHKIVGESNKIVRVLVELDANANRNQVLQQVNQFKDSTLRRNFKQVLNGFSLEIPSKYVGNIASIKGVKNVRLATQYTPLANASKRLTQVNEALNNYGNHGEGMVISIIDTGVDTAHKDMQTLKDPSKAKLPVSSESPEFTLKVPYGYNFADNSYNVKDFDGKSMHGMHVAGIAAANGNYDENNPGESVEGVASQAQILAMKVFTNNKNLETAYDDDILAAIEKSVELKADVINMSLGSANGFVDENNPVQKAIKYAESQGVIVVVAAGNESNALTNLAAGGEMFNSTGMDVSDSGLVSSPAIASGALSVASYENQLVLRNVGTLTSDNQTLSTFNFNADQGNIDDTNRDLVYVGLGRNEDYTEDVTGKYVLISRGSITFVDKVTNAYNHGAAGVLIFNNQPGEIRMVLAGAPDIFVTALTQSVGNELLSLLQQNPNAKLTLNPNLSYITNSNANKMSSFTSWGTTNTLDFKPEITGVGGNVYSTVNDNQYQYSSGTSMASPHVAGISTIVYAQLKKDLPNIENYATFVKRTLLNTATSLQTEQGISFTPRRQGAGLVQADAAMRNRVLATYETVDGEAVGELRDFTGSKTFNVVLKNYGSEAVSYHVHANNVQTTKNVEKELNGETVYVIEEQNSTATLTSDTQTVTLQPNEEKKVQFTLDASSVQNEFVEGFIQFESTESNAPSLNFAYLGYAGDWNYEDIFEEIDSKELNEEHVYGYTRLLTKLGEVYVPAGLSANDGFNAKYSYENAAISPNGDTAADEILPQFPTLRNVSKLEFNILDAKRNVIRKLHESEKVRRTYVGDFVNKISSQEQFIVPAYTSAQWDGTVYNATNGEMEKVADGTYYYQVKAYLRDSDEPQVLEFKVKVDTKAPELQVVNVEQVSNGVLVTFAVAEDNGLVYHYARLNGDGDEIAATKVADNLYTVVIPNTALTDSKVELVVKDSAYNETVIPVDLARTARFTNVEQKDVVDTQNELASLQLTLKDENTKKVEVIYTNLVDESEVRSSQTVANQSVNIETSLTTEGRYKVRVEEFDANDELISQVNIDNIVVDYTAPKITNVRSTASGVITATVQDNVFAINELLVYINDVLQTATVSGTTLTINNANPVSGDVLTVAQVKNGARGLSSNVVLTYTDTNNSSNVPPVPPLPTNSPEFNITFDTYEALGIGDIYTAENTDGKVIERDGKYYYQFGGRTNDTSVNIYANEELVTMNRRTNSFNKEIEIVEGINTINVIAVDQNDELLFEGNVKIFFDKTLPVLEWSNNLVLENVQDTTYLVVEEGTNEITLEGVLRDQGFGYGIEINGDYVSSKTETSTVLDYEVPFSKTITINNGDIITATISDALGNTRTNTLTVKKVAPDLPLITNISKQEYQGVQVSDVIADIPTGYSVEFVEDVDQLAIGVHNLNVVVNYPDNRQKTFEVTVNITANNPLSFSSNGVQVSGTEKEFGVDNHLSVTSDSAIVGATVVDTFSVNMNNTLNGEVTLRLPINKKNFEGVYYVDESGNKSPVQVAFDDDYAILTTSNLGTYEVVYDREPVVFTHDSVLVSSKYIQEGVELRTTLVSSSENQQVFDLSFYDINTNEKVSVDAGEHTVTLPKYNGRNVVSVTYLSDTNEELESFEFTQTDSNVTFTTSHFSKYALNYEPIAKEEVLEENLNNENGNNEIVAIDTPNTTTKDVDTSDISSTTFYVTLALASLALVVYLRRKEQ